MMDAAFHLQAGLDHGVDHMISVGLAESLTNEVHAPDFLSASLEPIIAAMTTRLEDHQNSGEMLRTVNACFAALSFVSPILLAHLHQKRLGGEVSHPLDQSDFLKQHARAFAESYGR